MSKKSFLSLVFAFTLIIFSTSTVQAEKSDPTGKPNRPETEDRRPIKTIIATAREKACQARESAVKTRMSQLTELVTNIETVFDKNALKVENYYNNILLPSGKTLPTYVTLLADITTQKAAVQTALGKAQADTDSFSCTGGNAKTLLNQYRLDMQAVKSALKDYRTSIKNMIQGVRSIAPKPTETAKPLVTPTPSI